MTDRPGFADARVLVVGMGGLGCPAALALAGAGVGTLVLADDDVVEESNLHRQLLYALADVGADKLDAAGRALSESFPATRVELVRSRLLPENARALVRSVDVVVEGADNFATKFLACDAAWLERVPVVHSAAIRWVGTAWAVGPRGRPCYRCLFEDVPGGAQESCDAAGVLGPVVGLVGALAAELVLSVLSGDPSVFGVVCGYDGKRDRLRPTPVAARPECPLCGVAPTVLDVAEARYLAPARAATCGAPSPEAPAQ
ncbi:MAG: HesA/MoeB/ThiF family protein [Polyangiaceae bacterium]|nr:HesA/MoeB/ThiF family protein [Polyangiaceae bacterium]